MEESKLVRNERKEKTKFYKKEKSKDVSDEGRNEDGKKTNKGSFILREKGNGK